ncbi:hypothetical protein [Streptomyces atratus]|uniref:hypothetical protein n=1 Tax=Streptomyces atratus TaxID=1893 RepID=UPI0013006C68|nr:hypothetical protein [Streptomyces atratus]
MVARTERCRLAFSPVMEIYGRPLAKMPTEPSAFPSAETVIAFVAAGMAAPTAAQAKAPASGS